jgi:hypothetical protein
MMRTLEKDAWLWLDLEGVNGEPLAMMTDFGVMGVDCEAMVRDLKKLRRF